MGVGKITGTSGMAGSDRRRKERERQKWSAAVDTCLKLTSELRAARVR
jgi:hypothetical protein